MEEEMRENEERGSKRSYKSRKERRGIDRPVKRGNVREK